MRPWLAVGWAAWLLALACWTAALLSPEPPRTGAEVLPPSWLVWVAKSLHVSAYACFAFAAGWLTPARRARGALWGGLALHGALTEWGQLYVDGRTGSLRDVLLDVGGVLLGSLAASAFARKR